MTFSSPSRRPERRSPCGLSPKPRNLLQPQCPRQRRTGRAVRLEHRRGGRSHCLHQCLSEQVSKDARRPSGQRRDRKIHEVAGWPLGSSPLPGTWGDPALVPDHLPVFVELPWRGRGVCVLSCDVIREPRGNVVLPGKMSRNQKLGFWVGTHRISGAD